jgi:DNA-binding IclR family transcriptional regulator
VIAVTNAIEVAELSTAGDRQEMAEEILSLLRLNRQARELRENGFEIGISCQKEGITASATPAGGTVPTLMARVNVAEWWDPKQLSNDEWSRQLAHALAAALRAARKRAAIADDRARYE